MIKITRKLELEVFFLLILAVIIGLVVSMFKNGSFQSPFNVASGASMQIEPEVVSPKVTVSSQISPDGTKKVILKETQNADETSTYQISTIDEDGLNEQLVFTKILDSTKNMSIPFNTWSPDDNYFFIQENAGVNKSVFAFKATGAPFAEGQVFLDVTDLFAKADTGNNFAVATGWASETLIIINTVKDNKTKGPSYWFEVPSKAIIQLSTDF